ncbi:MAG: purple acid phosphatase family protein, partial [Frankia sp.]
MPPPPVEQLHLTFGSDPAREMAVSWVTREPTTLLRVVATPDDPATEPAHPEPAHPGSAHPGSAQPGWERGPGSGAHSGSERDLGGPPAGARGSVGPSVEATAATRPFVEAQTGERAFMHHALLVGLEPDRRYRYTVEGGRGGTLRTAPAGRAAFTFTSVGDHGSPNPADRFGSPAGARVTAGIGAVDPLFHLVTGDLSYANMSDDRMRTWRNWFTSIEPSASHRPWMPIAGNHEVELGNGPLGYDSYQARFLLPDNGEDPATAGLWYTFRVGGARFIALNADDVCYQPCEPQLYLRGYSDGRQTAWLERTLKSARADPDTDWIIVFTHQAFASTAARQNGCDLGIREEWGPLFDAYEVDLVLCGHDHHYERTHPVRGPVAGSPTRTPQVVATRTDVIDTTSGTVHALVGFGGADNPSNENLFDPPSASVIVGVEPREEEATMRAARLIEPAPWSAVRGLRHPNGFAR